MTLRNSTTPLVYTLMCSNKESFRRSNGSRSEMNRVPKPGDKKSDLLGRLIDDLTYKRQKTFVSLSSFRDFFGSFVLLCP
jgi:hypothetical protein